jgi:ABC-2 type transport system permease protein
MPEFLRGITGFMPLTYINDALRAVVNEGAGLFAIGPELLGMAVWLVIAFVVAVMLFRWE